MRLPNEMNFLSILALPREPKAGFICNQKKNETVLIKTLFLSITVYKQINKKFIYFS